MSSLVTCGGFTKECIEVFLKRLEEMAAPCERQYVNMGWWFQCYAADTIGMITFSKRFGFLDRGEDQGGLAAAMHSNFTYASMVGVYYQVHATLFRATAWMAEFGLVQHTGE